MWVERTFKCMFVHIRKKEVTALCVPGEYILLWLFAREHMNVSVSVSCPDAELDRSNYH